MAAGRRCPGRLGERDGLARSCPRILTGRATHCPDHTPVYGAEHRRLRSQWQNKVSAGGVRCATCRQPLAGRVWDLGHTDDRTGYVGPQCRACNRKDGSKRAREG